MPNLISSLCMGYKLIESHHMTTSDGKTAKYIPREFKERWFGKLYGKTWRPFVSEKLIIVTRWIPDPSFYVMGDTIMGHPESLRDLRLELERRDMENRCSYEMSYLPRPEDSNLHRTNCAS